MSVTWSITHYKSFRPIGVDTVVWQRVLGDMIMVFAGTKRQKYVYCLKADSRPRKNIYPKWIENVQYHWNVAKYKA